MPLGQDCRPPQPSVRHGERRTDDFQKVIELVADIAGRPLQCPSQHVSDLVDRQIQHMSVELATNVRIPYRSRLGKLTLPRVVEPLDHHGCVNE